MWCHLVYKLALSVHCLKNGAQYYGAYMFRGYLSTQCSIATLSTSHTATY
jgi:hypothetical protein